MELTAREREILGLTIAGEINPANSPYGRPATNQEIANILETVMTRRATGDPSRYGTPNWVFDDLADIVLQPRQYSTWNDPESVQTARDNYSVYRDQINAALDAFFSGELQPTHKGITHYLNPKIVNPGPNHWSK